MLKKILLISAGIVLAAAGTMALLNPQEVAALLVYVAGAVILLSGIVAVMVALLSEFSGGQKPLIGLAVANILLGVLIMLIQDVFILLLGVGVVLVGCSLAVIAALKKRQGYSWLGNMCAAAMCIAAGVVLMLFFRQIQAFIGIVLGVSLVVVGVILTITGIAAPRAK